MSEIKGFRKQLSRVITSFETCKINDSSGQPAPQVPALIFSSIAVDCGCHCKRARKRKKVHDPQAKPAEESKPDQSHSPPRQKIDFNISRDDCTSSDGSTDNDSDSGSVVITSSDDEGFTMLLQEKKTKNRGVSPCLSRGSSAVSGWFSSSDRWDSKEMSNQFSSTSSSTSVSSDLLSVLANEKKVGRSGSELGEARVSAVERLLPWKVASGKVASESMAVVKRSEDPYKDFRRSMLEMIAEKRLEKKAGELEQLLRCFLSLNSRAHHPVIIRAFSDIWDSLLPL